MKHICSICNESFSKGVLLSNHIRWKHKPKTDSSLFQPKCSCIICTKEMPVQNFERHYKTHFKPQKEAKICPQCNKHHYKTGRFCSHSCGAKYSNSKKDYSKIKLGPPKGTIPKHYIPYTKVSVCTICKKYHTRTGKTCSDICYKQQLSISIRKSGYEFAKNRGRHKKSYLEESFENWLLSHNYHNFIPEHKIKNTHEKKVYYADFYFPDKNLIIELDGSQHKNTIEKDQQRDEYIKKYYGLKIIRITHKEYRLKSRTEEIKSLLNIE